MDVNVTATSPSASGWTWHDYAPGCRILQCAGERQYWVFGLKWLPTVGVRSRKLLLRQLHRERIRWWAGPQTGAGTVGFLPYAPKGSTRETHGLSAAVHYASQCPTGVHMLILRLQVDRYWVVAVNEGNVLSQTDCWIESQEQVQDIETAIRQRFANLQVALHDLVECDLAAAPGLAFLRVPCTDPRASLRRLRTSPAKWVVVPGLAALCLIAWMNWAPSIEGRRTHKESAHQQSQENPVDMPVVELVDPADLSRVAQVWEELPVDPPGWLLERVTCDWKLRTVDCRATYSRQAPRVTNQHLSPVAEAGWQIVPSSIDRTEAIRSLPYRPRHIRHDEFASLRTEIAGESEWLTSLQALSAFAYSIEFSQPVLVSSLMAASSTAAVESRSHNDEVDAREGRDRHLEFAKPLPVRPLQRRMVRLSLPLRHIVRVESLPIHVRWKSAHLEVVSPSLGLPGTTRLRAFLEGDLIDAS